MRMSVVPQLRCPTSGDALKCIPYKILGDEVIDGILTSSCKTAYVIQRGVPQLLTPPNVLSSFRHSYEKRLRKDVPGLAFHCHADDFSFSYQWTLHSYDGLTWEMFLPERLELFARYFDVTLESIAGARLLDAGCGNGTLSAALAQLGLEVFALDYSSSVYRAFEARLLDSTVDAEAQGRLHYLQGDVRQPPFADEYFDFVYADGVLHHTPDTKAAFLSLARKVKRGGQFFVWLYRRDLPAAARLKLDTVNFGRRALRSVPHRGKLPLCYVGAAILLSHLWLMRLVGYRRRRMIPLRLKALNLFDTFSPQFNHEHTPVEVASWYREAGFANVRDVAFREYRFNDEGLALVGTKR